MSIGGFGSFAARENIRLRWRGRMNQARTRYRVMLSVEVAAHVCHEWSDVFPADRPLGDALRFVAEKYETFYRELIARRRAGDTAAARPVMA